MRSGSLGNLIIAARLHRVNEVREENRILDEEDGDIVSDDICFPLAVLLVIRGIDLTKIAFIGIESCCETVDIACCVGTSATSGYGGEADEHGRFLVLCTEK